MARYYYAAVNMANWAPDYGRGFASSDAMESKNGDTEDRIDEALRDSFPASDPPAWGAIAQHDREARTPKTSLPLAVLALTAVAVMGKKVWRIRRPSSHFKLLGDLVAMR